MDNPEKLATRRRQTEQTHNTACVGHHYDVNNTNNVNKKNEPSYKQLEVKTNRASFLSGNRNLRVFITLNKYCSLSMSLHIVHTCNL
jgi:hypothetical protein